MRRSSIDAKCGFGFSVIVLVSSLAVIVKGWSFNTPQRDRVVGLTRKHSNWQEFSAVETSSGETARTTTTLFLSSENPEAGSGEEELSTMVQEVSGMRLSEIKAELKERIVDFSDCFDKESMVSKLADARINNIDNKNDSRGNGEDESDGGDDEDKGENAENSTGDFDREAAQEQLKGMRVRELREELGRRRISRAGLFEKEDLVNALLEARAVASVFSATGVLTPGEVTELPEDDVRKEIDHPGSLMLLDVYATWCGPCQMIAPFLKEIAAEQGDQLRIVKMDSDKNPGLSSELKVQGLPTLVLFQGGNEVNRIEGAPTKEQLMGWIDSHR